MSSSEAEEGALVIDDGETAPAAAAAGPGVAGASRARAAQIDDERALLDAHFVGLVRGYEQLYMRDHPFYGSRRRSNAIWAEIGTIVNQPAEECKKRWKRLRGTYYNYLERARTGSKERPRPAHEMMMTFLDRPCPAANTNHNRLSKTVHEYHKEASENDYVEHRRPSESDVRDVDQSSEDLNSETAAPAHTLQDSSEDEDDVVDFFVELGESVKDLPEAVRIHVKREAFRIVTDAEEMLYQRKLGLDAQMNMSE
ncbi:hypothetical protein PYW07_004862 [Mythimna separata]|uniref:MADF domain-containing protein n=1 Tax=Mythimna separata TaxID=271217 RepID=A0AAD7YDE4_MYTSE|nr:hypothetical protein PYW07_004862 [Mythimna separata]